MHSPFRNTPWVIPWTVIKSFRDKDTQAIFEEKSVRKFQAVEEIALKKLLTLDAAASLEDLRSIRGNRLEALKGDRKGQFSIRVNDQYRICFEWEGSDAFKVELTDYH